MELKKTIYIPEVYVGRPRVLKIPGKKYPTINGCLAAFFDCEVGELCSLSGRFEMRWADGNESKWEVQEAIKKFRKKRCWGWVEDKTFLHYFIRKSATMVDLVKLFGHEIGHMQRPWHRGLKEEQKADKYANMAAAAYCVAEQAYREIHGEWA